MRVIHILHSHLLIAISTAYIAGITFSHFSFFSQSTLLSLLFTAIVIIFFILKRNENIVTYLLLLFFVQIGILSGNTILSPPDDPHHVLNLFDLQEETVVIGKIRRIHSFDGVKTRFDIQSLSLRTKNSFYVHSRGIIRYTLKAELPHSVYPGTIVAIRAKLKRPSRYNNEGSFDYPRHLALQDIWITGYISSPLYIQKVNSGLSFLNKLPFSTEIQREKIKRFIDSNLAKENAALYKALITGDRSSISSDVLEQFKGAGCMHILAISGIHMSLLGLFLFSIIFWLLRRSTWLILNINTKKTAAILCVIPLALYSLIAGAQTPVIRSLIMSLIVITAICCGRKYSFFTLVACAAFLILAFSPSDLFTPSFQLTFTAVLSITSIVPLIKHICTSKTGAENEFIPSSRLKTWLVSALGISVAATLGTAPILLFYFNRLSLVGPIANLIIEPLICFWSLTAGFLATIFIFIFPAVAALLFKAGAVGLLLATKSVYFFNSFSFSSVRLPAPSILQIFTYYLSLIGVFRLQLLPKSLKTIALTSLILSLIFFWIPPTELLKFSRKHSSLTILDVGHGSTALIELPNGKRILIDGGAISSPEYNIGERVIAPFLWKKGITRIDEVIVTHPDSDHYNGIPFILKHFGVKRLWINGTKEEDLSWQNVLSFAKQNNISIQVPTLGTIISCSQEACVQILANTAQDSEEGNVVIKNEESLIVNFTHGNFSAIFPGDITTNIEEKLIRNKVGLKATLLLAAHHGSATSNSRSFLKAVSPQYLVVSASPNRSKNFPAPGLSSLCDELGITMLQTAQSGAISVTSTGKKYSLDTFLPRQHDKKLKLQ